MGTFAIRAFTAEDESFLDPEELEADPPPPEGVGQANWAKENDFVGKRMEYLRGLLGRLLYDADRHPNVLAAKWGVSAARVRGMVNEAMKQVELLQGDNSKAASLTIVERLLTISKKAEEAGSYMAAVSALKAAGEFTIDPKANKTEVSHTLRMLSDAELDALYLKEAAAADQFRKQLAEKSGQTVIDAEFVEMNGDRITPLSAPDDNDPEGTA